MENELDYGFVVVEDWDFDGVRTGMIGYYDDDAMEDEDEGIEEGDKIVYFSHLPAPLIIPSYCLRKPTDEELFDWSIKNSLNPDPMISSIKRHLQKGKSN